jgi:hypothetical protein
MRTTTKDERERQRLELIEKRRKQLEELGWDDVITTPGKKLKNSPKNKKQQRKKYQNISKLGLSQYNEETNNAEA